MNSGLKELAGGNLGAALGVAVVVIIEQFTTVEWAGENDLLLVLAVQAVWSFIRPYIPHPPKRDAT